MIERQPPGVRGDQWKTIYRQRQIRKQEEAARQARAASGLVHPAALLRPHGGSSVPGGIGLTANNVSAEKVQSMPPSSAGASLVAGGQVATPQE